MNKWELSSKQIFTSFYQTDYDCVPIALIKAAIDRYGLFHVLDKTSFDGNVYSVILKNKSKLKIKHKEFLTVAKSIKLKFRKPPKGKTNKINYFLLQNVIYLLYAVIVKQVQKVGYYDEFDKVEKQKTFKDALECVFEYGLCTDHAYRYLGLKKVSIQEMNAKTLIKIKVKGKGIIVYTNYHAMAVSNGAYDYYGDLVKLKANTNVNGEPVSWWYQLE